MSYEEIQKFGMEHYNNGGDVIVECWGKAEVEWVEKEMGRKFTEKDLYELCGIWEEEERAGSEYM